MIKVLLSFKKIGFLAAILLIITTCMPNEPEQSTPGYQLTPIPFNQVDLEDDFWQPRLKTQAEVLVPFALNKTLPAVENVGSVLAFKRLLPSVLATYLFFLDHRGGKWF